jgi:hypothetical protein
MTEIDKVLVRTRETVAEHEPHGWLVETPIYTVSSSVKRPGYYMNCSCGWRGWIAEDPEHPVRETYQQSF